MRHLVLPLTIGLCTSTVVALIGFVRRLILTIRQARGSDGRLLYRSVMLPRPLDFAFVGLASLSVLALNPFGPLWTARTSDIPFLMLLWLVFAWPFVLGVLLTRLGAAVLVHRVGLLPGGKAWTRHPELGDYGGWAVRDSSSTGIVSAGAGMSGSWVVGDVFKGWFAK